MQKEQGERCAASSVPHIGLHTASKPTFQDEKAPFLQGRAEDPLK